MIAKEIKKITLRPHQEAGLSLVRQAALAGHKSIMLAAPCSYGKTVWAAQVCQEAAAKNRKVLFLVDRTQLQEQAFKELHSFGVAVGVRAKYHQHSQHLHQAQTHICTIQSLAAQHRREPGLLRQLGYDIWIVDEAHQQHELVWKMREAQPGVMLLGLSATPYSRSLGQLYSHLAVPVDTEALMEQGFLTPVDYYGGASPDLSGFRTYLDPKTGRREYREADCEQAMGKVMAGDVIENYERIAPGTQAIGFAATVAQSQAMAKAFFDAQIPAVHIDGTMEQSEREEIYKAFSLGQIRVLWCSKLLGVGFSETGVETLIDCAPTASRSVLIQRAGRLFRLHRGKKRAKYLDHAGNITRLGRPERAKCSGLDMTPRNEKPEKLEDETQVEQTWVCPGCALVNGAEQPFCECGEKQPEAEPNIWECPECFLEASGLRCECGFDVRQPKPVVTDHQQLVQLPDRLPGAAKMSSYQAGQFYAELLAVCAEENKPYAWAHRVFFEKMRGHTLPQVTPASAISQGTRNFIKSVQIRWAKQRAKQFGR